MTTERTYKYALGETVYYGDNKHTIIGAGYRDNMPKYQLSGNSFWKFEHDIKTPAEYWKYKMNDAKKQHKVAIEKIRELTHNLTRHANNIQQYRTNYIMCGKVEEK